MAGRLEGRVALVTGAASGIGASCARRFAEEGARIVGFDLTTSGGPEWDAATACAPASTLQVVDVRSEDAVQAAVEDALARVGQIDTVVNAAGIAGGGPVHLVSLEDWNRVIGVNLTGTFLVSKHVLRGMLERRAGSIVNIASIEGLEGSEGGSSYNASKGGVVLLTRNMAMDYARRGIRVNAVCPGFIETPLLRSVFDDMGLGEYRARVADAHLLGRFGRPEEIANAALFLASDESSFVTGHSLVVDGGYTAGHRHGFTALMGLDGD